MISQVTPSLIIILYKLVLISALLIILYDDWFAMSERRTFRYQVLINQRYYELSMRIEDGRKVTLRELIDDIISKKPLPTTEDEEVLENINPENHIIYQYPPGGIKDRKLLDLEEEIQIYSLFVFFSPDELASLTGDL